jgi:hypothetical protein
MSDFQLMQLCDKYKSMERFRLSSDVLLESGKVKTLLTTLATHKAQVCICVCVCVCVR